MNVGTVINKAWLAHARALAESLRAHEPDARMSVLIVDPIDDFFDPAQESFEILGPQDVEIEDFEGMSVRYGITELPHSEALPFALVLHLVNFVPFVLVGVFLLHYNSRHPWQATIIRARDVRHEATS